MSTNMSIGGNKGLTVQCKIHLRRGERGRVELHAGSEPLALTQRTGRVPKLARLMALAIRFEDLLRRGEVTDYAELARLGHVTRARITQIMNLLLLAPEIQEAILYLPEVECGHDPIHEWQVRPIAAEPLWKRQRKLWDSTFKRRPGVRLASKRQVIHSISTPGIPTEAT